MEMRDGFLPLTLSPCLGASAWAQSSSPLPSRPVVVPGFAPTAVSVGSKWFF
jgi:hypothetical protein